MSRIIAVGDIGGAHARFALAEIGEGKVDKLGDPIILETAPVPISNPPERSLTNAAATPFRPN